MQHGPHIHQAGALRKVAYQTTLKDRRVLAKDTLELTLVKPEGFRFKAGQHARLTLDLADVDDRGASRILTMASTPQDPDLVFAMRLSRSTFKQALSEGPLGQNVLLEMLVDSPHGSFALDESVESAVFLAGGIGIVPAYVMIRDATQRKTGQRLALFYSNRRPEDMAYWNELQNLATQNPLLQIIGTVTGPESSSVTDWKGSTGRISRPMLEAAQVDPEKAVFFVAGLPDMVRAMRTLLGNWRVDPQRILSEEFAGFHGGHRSPNTTRHIVTAAVVLGGIGMVALHVGGGLSLLHSNWLAWFSWTNWTSYGVLGLVLAAVGVKVVLASKLGKHTFRKRRRQERT